MHFLKGGIERVPLPANSIEVIIFDRVIKLAAPDAKLQRLAAQVDGKFASGSSSATRPAQAPSGAEASASSRPRGARS